MIGTHCFLAHREVLRYRNGDDDNSASGDYPGVCLWTIPTGNQTGVIDFALPSGEDMDRHTLGCEISPDGKILAATLLVWQL